MRRVVPRALGQLWLWHPTGRPQSPTSMWAGHGVLSSSIRPSRQRSHHLRAGPVINGIPCVDCCGAQAWFSRKTCHWIRALTVWIVVPTKNLSAPLLTNELLHLCRVTSNRSINSSQRCNGRSEGFTDSFPRLTTVIMFNNGTQKKAAWASRRSVVTRECCPASSFRIRVRSAVR